VPAPMAQPPTRPLILLVDDDPTVRLTLARALTERGYDVRTAADGQAAITILEGLGTLPAIAVTDLQMRGGSGEELARLLARRYPDLPVIFITAYLARYRAAYLPGPLLEKPFRAEQLCELIGSVLAAVSERQAQSAAVRRNGLAGIGEQADGGDDGSRSRDAPTPPPTPL
jgi:CheY-like chemotaxis protein